MNTRIAFSILTILASAGIMAGATFAFFSDQGTSTNNTFSAGTFDLLLTDNNQTAVDDVTATFGDSNMGPGDCSDSQTLELKNGGTVAGNHVDITASNSDGTMSPFLRINSLTYDGGDVLPNIIESGNNAYKDLADWAADSDGLDELALTNLNTNHPLVMVVCLDESATSTVEGLSDNLSLTATLRQQSHGSE